MIYFTSDTHFGHKNIIKYCDRPFRDTDHMDKVIIQRWNETVSPEDTVFHLGDIALGQIDKSLARVARLNGYKIAKLGNHDRPFMDMDKPAKYDAWMERYREVFQEVWTWHDTRPVSIGGVFNISHFPYTGDHTPSDRHADKRPVDDGLPLIHGHTHTTDRLTYSSKGTPQIHVGQDAWDFRPVSEDEIMNIYVGG